MEIAEHDRPFAYTKIRKRDGRLVDFDRERIVEAIWKAAQSVGGSDRGVAQRLGSQVVETIVRKHSDGTMPSVEEVQDMVEKVLIENGHAKTAKAYILYRQKRAEVREEKRKVLEKEDIDDVDKVFDVNALRVLKARYLRKDDKGRLLESPGELFTRVAVHAGLPSLFYDERIFDRAGLQAVHPHDTFDPVGAQGRYKIGRYSLNRYHLDALKRLYDRFNGQGKIRVSWSEFVKKLEEGFFNAYEHEIQSFYEVMVSRRFMPNTPALANFGNPLGMGSACFVLGIDDSMESIMDTLKNTAMVFKAGGGVGYNFSRLRPEGDYVSSTSGIASGPISFMKLFDTMTEVIKQGGIRRGANMGILNINHPDIEKFITAKAGNKALRNFNISVLIMPDFWEHYERNEPYPLVNPRNGEVVRKVNPRMLFDLIVYQAWESAEPGVIFYDHVNKHNPLHDSLGPIVTTNPCGEVLLYPNESCNLGSINVWAFLKDGEGGPRIDWDGLASTVKICTRLLDNVIDVNKFPLKEIEEMGLATRKIGLGVMGLADLLFEIRVPYNSEEGREMMEKLMEFINYHSKLESIELAKNRGPFPYYGRSFFSEGRMPLQGFYDRESWHFDWAKVAEDVRTYGIRNAFTTVIAPTGSISMIAGCSSGIEPLYSLVFEKNVKVGSFYYVDPVFEDAMKSEGLYDDRLIEDIGNLGGTIRSIPYIPPLYKRIFVTAMDITPEDHIRALAAFQKWTDSSISKTNNFPADATVDDMRASYLLAYRLGCKDVTVFRDTSIKNQVLVAAKKESKERTNPAPTRSASEMDDIGYTYPPLLPSADDPNVGYLRSPGYSAGLAPTNGVFCPNCDVAAVAREGCAACPECGWSFCS